MSPKLPWRMNYDLHPKILNFSLTSANAQHALRLVAVMSLHWVHFAVIIIIIIMYRLDYRLGVSKPSSLMGTPTCTNTVETKLHPRGLR